MAHADLSLSVPPRSVAMQEGLAVAFPGMQTGIEDHRILHDMRFAVPGRMAVIGRCRRHHIMQLAHRHVFQSNIAAFETVRGKSAGNGRVDVAARLKRQRDRLNVTGNRLTRSGLTGPGCTIWRGRGLETAGIIPQAPR